MASPLGAQRQETPSGAPEVPTTSGTITLPVSRAFLVQLAADCKPEGHIVRGRVEHVRSGEAAHFQSLPELAAFMLEVLRQGERASS